MKKNGLTFNACKVYCFLPEDYWWKQLIGFGIGLLAVIILSLF